MSTRRRHKKTKSYYSVVPDSAYRKKTITKWLIGYMTRYGNVTAFVVGILIFVSGIIGEYLGLPGYQFTTNRLMSPSQLDPAYHKPKLVPYWVNCIAGLLFMSSYIKDKFKRK